MASEELCSRGTLACMVSAILGQGLGGWGADIRCGGPVNSTCYMTGKAEVTSQGQAESFLRARPVAPLGPSRRWSVESVCLRLLPGKASSVWTGLSSSQKRPMTERIPEIFLTEAVCQARAASLIYATRLGPCCFLLSPHLPEWQWHPWDKCFKFLYEEWWSEFQTTIKPQRIDFRDL